MTLEEQNAELLRQNAELLAHVERLRGVLENLQSTVEYADNGEGCYVAYGDLMISIDRIASENPAQSLEALKMQWRNELAGNLTVALNNTKTWGGSK